MKFVLILILITKLIFTQEIYEKTSNRFLLDKIKEQTDKSEITQTRKYFLYSQSDSDEYEFRTLKKVKNCEIHCRGCCLNNLCISENECKLLFFSTFALSLIVLGIISCSCLVALITVIVLIIGKTKRYYSENPCNKPKKENKNENVIKPGEMPYASIEMT